MLFCYWHNYRSSYFAQAIVSYNFLGYLIYLSWLLSSHGPLADQDDDLEALTLGERMDHIQRGQLLAMLCLEDEIADELREQGELDAAARIKGTL